MFGVREKLGKPDEAIQGVPRAARARCTSRVALDALDVALCSGAPCGPIAENLETRLNWPRRTSTLC